MKNDRFAAWKARLNYMKTDFPFGPIQRKTNEEGRLHADGEPAFISPTRITYYQNGRKHGIDADIFGTIHYYFDNIRIPPNYYTKPESLTVEEVLGHPNAEVRYVGMKALGMEKVLAHKKTKVVHRDEEKGMVLFRINGVFDEPVSYLKVVNSTAEPDGTFKNYYLCVPPTMKTCREAVAWTFNMKDSEYNPVHET